MSAHKTQNQKMNPTLTSKNQQSKASKRVRFDDSTITEYHDTITITPEELGKLWYAREELLENFHRDIRFTMREYFRRVREGKQKADKKYLAKITESDGSGEICYGRGLELLDEEQQGRNTRCALYRSLVRKQHKTLKSEMSESHAMELLAVFASQHSQWARDRASALAVEDAAEARKVYREAFLTKDGIDHGLGIFPMVKRGSPPREGRRKSGLARSA
jgi:hypothetical protein